MGRSVPRSSPKPPPKPPPKPRSGLCPELLADFRIPKPPGVLAGGTEGSFLCSPSSRFSGRGGGVGSLPRAWRGGWGAWGQRGLKKIGGLGGVFLSPPFGFSDFPGWGRPRSLGFPTGLWALSNPKGAGGGRGRGRETP